MQELLFSVLILMVNSLTCFQFEIYCSDRQTQKHITEHLLCLHHREFPETLLNRTSDNIVCGRCRRLVGRQKRPTSRTFVIYAVWRQRRHALSSTYVLFGCRTEQKSLFSLVAGLCGRQVDWLEIVGLLFVGVLLQCLQLPIQRRRMCLKTARAVLSRRTRVSARSTSSGLNFAVSVS